MLNCTQMQKNFLHTYCMVACVLVCTQMRPVTLFIRPIHECVLTLYEIVIYFNVFLTTDVVTLSI